MKLLLVEPDFPIPNKSKNHKDFLPIGLLKLGAMYRSKGDSVKLVRGEKSKDEISADGDGRWYVPDKILITSLFTYWKPYVEKAIKHYRGLFPGAAITVGGIYASLMPDDCKSILGVDDVYKGQHSEAEKFKPAYGLIEGNPEPLDYQVLHATRGCKRRCDFCGVYEIEPEFKSYRSIREKIVEGKPKLVFYDNNILKSPYIERLLDELIELKKEGKIRRCEAQSGFDGRILVKNPALANKLHKAGFRNPRIAWDWEYSEKDKIRDQVDILIGGGYNAKQIFIFMIYNWEIPFDEMESKRKKCFEWEVQIADCRYRPLDSTDDGYDPRAYRNGQTGEDYHIHKESGWTDTKVRRFRKNIRRQNICVRHDFPFYSKDLERKRFPREEVRRIIKEAESIPTRKEQKRFLENEGIHYWFPDE